MWHVLLGPYKVGPRGCEYEVHISFAEHTPPVTGTHPSQVTATRPVDLQPAAEPGWVRGDLHCHTLHSDGDSWPAEMLGRAVERGLDFLGVTDHNQVGHHADYASVQGSSLPIILPGVEVTTYGGHWNAWGTDRWWEFREPDTDAVSRAMRAAAASGALVSVNHPKPFGPPWEYGSAIGFHAVEVWNGAWAGLNHTSLGWWEAQLRAGRRLVALGGSDLHRLKSSDPDPRHARNLGTPTTWARVGDDRSVDGVLAALRAGRVFISASPFGPQLFVEPEADAMAIRVRAVGGRHAALAVISESGVVEAASVGSEDWTMRCRPPAPGGYLRVQLMDDYGQMLALSNPVHA
jgi:hypothetical protein